MPPQRSRSWCDFLTECTARDPKPLPMSKDFSYSKTADFTIFSQFCETGPSSKDFFGPKWDPCRRIFDEAVTHLGGTSPYALTCEYPGFLFLFLCLFVFFLLFNSFKFYFKVTP